MTRDQGVHVRGGRHGDGIISAVAVGAVFILIGIVFITTPNLATSIGDFFGDMTTAQFPFGSSSSTIALPAPAHPGSHTTVYSAWTQFDFGIGILQVVILVWRLMIGSPLRRKSETLGNLVFWFGAAFLTMSVLSVGTTTSWFEYWSALVMLVGITVVLRAIIHLVAGKRK